MTSLNNKFWGFWKNWIHNSFHIKFYSYTLILTFRALCGKPVKNPLLGLKRALDYPCTGHFRFLWCVPEINVLWVAALYKIFAWAEKSCVIATKPHRNRLVDETSWAALKKSPFFCHTFTVSSSSCQRNFEYLIMFYCCVSRGSKQ